MSAFEFITAEGVIYESEVIQIHWVSDRKILSAEWRQPGILGRAERRYRQGSGADE